MRSYLQSMQSVKTFFLHQETNGKQLVPYFLVFLKSVFCLATRGLGCYSLNWDGSFSRWSQWKIFFFLMCVPTVHFKLLLSQFLGCDKLHKWGAKQSLSGNAKWCCFKCILIIKQSCCSLHPSIFHSLCRLLHRLPQKRKWELLQPRY